MSCIMSPERVLINVYIKHDNEHKTSLITCHSDISYFLETIRLESY